MFAKSLALLSGLALSAIPAAAQLISVKTVPVAQADQFAIYPSRNLAMGGVRIALEDPLLDPFANPAEGSRIAEARFFGTPFLYSVSSDAGGGRTLPVAASAKLEPWFGAFALALQQVDGAVRNRFGPVAEFGRLLPGDVALPRDLNARSYSNEMAFAMLGRRLPEKRLALGASVFWAGLNAIDGVDLLYAGSFGIKQYGNAMDLRAGLLKDWEEGRTLEILALYNRFRMAHDVFYLDPVWDPNTQLVGWKPRMERNLDWNDIFGLHLEYRRPLSADGWKVGWIATYNRMSHPQIPNYEIMSIPKDPGYSNAFNFGIGISREREKVSFGVDLVYEPIWSRTWADAEAPVQGASGIVIPAGQRTVENDFRFSNILFRTGVTRDLGDAVAFQLGLALRSIHYWLTQYDNVNLTVRDQVEQWVEWTPTWGLEVRFPELELRYQGRVTNGTGRPGVAPRAGRGGFLEASGPGTVSGTVIVAPSGPLTLAEVKVVTHQVGIAIPIR
ncbi:hypothetical protein HRbin33_01624 [bacterium HR33]|nr:hypothetical protein HRbin33_01624 [bacterium HR33]